MIILLDIDGVMVTTPSWKPTEDMPDGFPNFKFNAIISLNLILEETNAKIVLTTTHKGRFNQRKWKEIFLSRKIRLKSIDKIQEPEYYNASGSDRLSEIMEWVRTNNTDKYVIIDDDKRLNGLPKNIKKHLVLIDPLIGLTQDDAEKAISILVGRQWGEE
ncbi:MAG: hypothetical protein J0L69_12955 [Bacteroidetes bacterium]|nr:hypothetical protein [Bacteroidota bacterium]